MRTRKKRFDETSPDPDGPFVGASWYAGAAYCNWLSKQDGLGDDQLCYLKNKDGAYAEGMSIPGNVLQAQRLSLADRSRMGIHLPSGSAGRAAITASRSNCSGRMPGT